MAAERGTPEWWRDRLLKKYEEDLRYRTLNAAFYDSINPSPELSSKYREAYARLLAMSKTPWGRLVVDIVAERLTVNGFKVGENSDVDIDAWGTFRRNKMEALQRQVHREALAVGTSYASVFPEDGRPKIAYESAMSVTHETKAGDPHATAAAIKVWHDPSEARLRCNLYLPEATFKFRSHSEVSDETFARQAQGNSLWVNATWDETGEVANPYEIVPVVPFVVRPTWEGYGVSDLEDLHSIILRVESIVANTLLAIEFGAFRQKWATGLEIPVDEDGNPIEPFSVALDRLWATEDPDTKFGAFDATDVRPYLQAVSDAIGQLSAVSRIPTLYFNQSELSNPPSAASLEAAETGLIKKVGERQGRFSESWEQVAGMALGTNAPIEVSWDDPRTRSEAQMMDAAVKLGTIGVPFQGLMEFLGYDAEAVERLKKMRATDTFDRLLQTPLPTATRLNTQEQPRPAQGE